MNGKCSVVVVAIFLAQFFLGNAAAIAEPTLAELRVQRDAELKRIRTTYDQRAVQEVPRNPDGTLKVDSPEYKNLLKDYQTATKAARGTYASQDPRGAMIDNILGNHPGISNTGSKPSDVYADVDLAGNSPDASQRLADEWRAKGHQVEAVRTPDGEIVKHINRTTDTTLWNPETPGIREWKVSDPDAWSTAGGQKGTGNIDRPSDPRGYVIDNEGKFVHSDNATRFSGHDEDLKTFSKSVDKAGTHVDLQQQNPEFYDQAKKLRSYNDVVEAGIAHLGDTPEVQAQKVEDWKQQGRDEMSKAKVESEVRGGRIDDLRTQLADQVGERLNRTPSELRGDNAGMDDRMRGRMDDAQTSREAQAAENKRMAEEHGPHKSPTDAEANRTATADESGTKPADADGGARTGDTPGGKPGDVDGSTRTGDAPGGKPGDVEGGARTGDADGASRTGDTDGGRTTDVDGTRTAAGDTSDGRSGTSPDGDGARTGDADGTRTGADVDSSGSRPAGAADDGTTRVGADAEMGAGRKALNKLGEGMTGVDILNAGQNALDVMDGKKGAGEAALETADALSGGAYTTGKMLKDKGSDYLGAQGAVSEAQASADASRVVETAQNLADAGVSQEDRLAIMNAMSQGDESLLQNKVDELKAQGIDVTVPEREIVGTESDDTAWQRGGEVLTGIKDQTVRAGEFAVNTGKDLAEIGSGLTEEGVADALIEQQSENLSLDNLSEGAGAIGSMMDDAGTMNERREDNLGIEGRLGSALDRDRDTFRSDMTEEEIAAQYRENREQNRPGFQGLLAGSEGTDPATGDKVPVESSVLPGVDLSEHPEIQAIVGQLEGRSQDEIDAVLRIVLADKPEVATAGDSNEGKPGEGSSEGSGTTGEGEEETGNPPVGSGEDENPLTDEEKEALRQFLLGLVENPDGEGSDETDEEFPDEGDFGEGGSGGETRRLGSGTVTGADFQDEGDFADPTVNEGANTEWRVARIPLPGIDPADFARDNSEGGTGGEEYAADTMYQVIYQCSTCLKIHSGGTFNDQQAALAASQSFTGQGYRVRIVPRGGGR